MTPTIRTLDFACLPYKVPSYDDNPASTAYGTEAAQALGVSDDEMFKTLIASADGIFVVAMVPMSCTVNLNRLAGAVGKKHAEMANPADAQRSSGYVVAQDRPKRRSLSAATAAMSWWNMWGRLVAMQNWPHCWRGDPAGDPP